jgi:hypothetical protein
VNRLPTGKTLFFANQRFISYEGAYEITTIRPAEWQKPGINTLYLPLFFEGNKCCLTFLVGWWYSATGPSINKDWSNRDFTEGIKLNILKITDFLNRFGNIFSLLFCAIKIAFSDCSTRYKLGLINDKLTHLERRFDSFSFLKVLDFINPLCLP